MNLSNTYNLEVLYPEIAKEWHPKKNCDLTPDKVTPGSTKKVWWICARGHEWEAKISPRTRGSGCPRCGSNTATKEHNLMIMRPDIADQWHPGKNVLLTPEDVTPVSKRKVWWECSKGHEWMDVIRARTKYNNGCPYCSGIDGYREYNLSALHPDIASQWHPTKNGTLTPDDVTPGSDKKVWWVCGKGHEWQTTVRLRSIQGNGCPYCSGKKASIEYNLLKIYPEVARQWHPTMNHNLKPDKVTPGSRKKVWWVCDKGHEWQAIIESRSIGHDGCPYCAGTNASKDYNFLKSYPEIAKQWHPVKNGQLTPDKVTPGSHKKVWWLCAKRHEWEATIKSKIRNKNTCPFCSRKKVSKEYNLSVVFPEIAKQWHPTKNPDLTPDKVTPGSPKKVWWQCNKGHEWQAVIWNRNFKRSGCPYCARKRKK